ncbi:MAG: hypothetical protein IKZ38_00735 [Clostridia bacterium]|nr:hypothetical protein [Clostridia bacterium]
MFVSHGQFYVFIASVSIGCVSGIIFSVVVEFSKLFKNRIVLQIGYGLSLILASISFVYFQYKLSFPSLRFYMIVGVFLGLIVYAKTFNLMLAKALKKLYNIIRKTKLSYLDKKRVKSVGVKDERR